MKKVLLLIAIAATTAMASAVEPQVLEDVTINKLSPDGNFGVSDINPILTIFDFANNQTYVYDGTDGTYTAGNGNCISSSGIVVGSVDDTTPTYWENGTWNALPTGEAEGTCSVNGITPDGSRMCGIVSSTTTGETIILPASTRQVPSSPNGRRNRSVPSRRITCLTKSWLRIMRLLMHTMEAGTIPSYCQIPLII